MATDASSERINRLLYQRLVEFDDASQPVPGIADWRRLTPTRYRLTLRPERRPFSDGAPVTAADVAATYASVLDPATGSPHRAPLTLIDRIEVLDSERLDFWLREPDALFPAYLGLGILPARAIATDLDARRQPLGSGPFRLLDWSEPWRLSIERRDDAQRVDFVAVPDPNVRVMKLLRGEIDLLQNDLPPELIAYLRRQPDIRVRDRPGVNHSYLGFNCADPRLAPRAAREAIALALDRATILRYLFKDQGRPAEALLPPEHWAGARNLPTRARDLDRARALLAELGYTAEHPLRLVYKTSSDPFRLRIATLIQAQLAEAGIDLRIQSHDWGTFFGDIKTGRFQLYSLTWVGVRTPDIFRYAYHSASVPPAGANRGRCLDPELDRLIDTARAASDPAAAAALYRAAQERLWRQLPTLPLWFENQIVAMRTDLTGYLLASDGGYDGLTLIRGRD